VSIMDRLYSIRIIKNQYLRCEEEKFLRTLPLQKEAVAEYLTWMPYVPLQVVVSAEIKQEMVVV